MTSARAKEVLYDSEVMLRRVDRELDELRDDLASMQDVGTLLSSVQQARVEIDHVLYTLRDHRHISHGTVSDQLHDRMEQRLLAIADLLSGTSLATTHRPLP